MVEIAKVDSWAVLDAENLSDMIDIEDIFGRSGPFHVEIGSGRGSFLVSQAACDPHVNFLGIEWASKFYRSSAKRIRYWNLRNVRLVRTDAASFITENLPDESVDCFHIYFPDPWPKTRHHRRRIFRDEIIDQILRALRKGGKIQLATDHDNYFAQMEKLIRQRSDVLKEAVFDHPACAKPGEIVGTNYERKYIPENRKTFYTAVEKL